MPKNYTANDVLRLAEELLIRLNSVEVIPGETIKEAKKGLLASLTLEQVIAGHLVNSISEEESGLKSEKAELLLPRYAETMNMMQKNGDEWTTWVAGYGVVVRCSMQTKVADIPWPSEAQLSGFLKQIKFILDLNDH